MHLARWARDISVLRMSGVQALLLVAKSRSRVGIFNVGHAGARCVPSCSDSPSVPSQYCLVVLNC